MNEVYKLLQSWVKEKHNLNIIEKYFKNWVSFSKIQKNPDILPKNNSQYVYCIRLKDRKVERLVGLTDILYIGKTTNLVQRFVKNYLKDVGGLTTQRIHKYLFEKGYLDKVEVSWCEVEDFEKVEKELLESFEEEHHELPSWNRQG
ncbi:MAG: GIY-YIG nuclease family protein [Candidatus Aenigmatarchaeota archaeon]